jgi:hypothetical protein
MTKVRMLKLFILVMIMSIIIYYVNSRIKAFDMRFYHGKDDGAFVIIESISIISSVFYLVMSRKYRIIHFFGGLLIGLISSIISYLLVSAFYIDKILNDFELTFYILGCVFFITTFFLIDKIIESRSIKK